MDKRVFFFGEGKAEGNKEMSKLLGGKGANLAEMTALKLPVPPGFTITTEVCAFYYQCEKSYPPGFEHEVDEALKRLEKVTGSQFGNPGNPMLVSVRSGARSSMPGMMDTILNLGLNDETVVGLARESTDERFALDAYRRFIQMYGEVVLGVAPHYFESGLTALRNKRGVDSDYELSAGDLNGLVREFKQIVLRETMKPFPMAVKEQLWGAIGAVFGSWMSPRAVSYRRIHHISEDFGTAVNIQAMVFGNMGMNSASGVAFTRDPSNGEKRFFGEFLQNSQGEDVVAGIRTPFPLNIETGNGNEGATLEDLFPAPYKELVVLYKRLETHYRDMQDIEFTIQKGRLYLLQTRNGKRTASAAVRIAVDMVREGLITKTEAIKRVTTEQVEQLLHPRLDPKYPKQVIAKGLPASPGAASGQVIFSSEEAEKLREKGTAVILVRHETSPEDISGMDAAEGILTALGGMTSHAAVVARGMGKPCVAGCGSIDIDYKKQQFIVQGMTVRRGDMLTVDGTTGEVILGYVPTVNSQVDEYFTEFMGWVDELRRLKIRANAETPNDVKVARQFGAEGVGLCRTEHMFFESDRILAVRELILADSKAQREAALKIIFPMQRDDFIAIFTEMKGYPVTIRLLDPPLHEFLPSTPSEWSELAEHLNSSIEFIQNKVKGLKEQNPMLGHRGCRIAISFPEIYQMQVRAIMEAACHLIESRDYRIEPEIMIPFVVSIKEIQDIKEQIVQTCEEVLRKYKLKVVYSIGTMIEIPRAAFIADQLGAITEFFSFGTNDLTQMTLGLSRDDAGAFLPKYVDKGIFPIDPFVSLDQMGVGELMRIACVKGKQSNPKIKLGICGEHGGDPKTIHFCHKLGIDYVSCSPFRVPVARLAAAQATIESTG